MNGALDKLSNNRAKCQSVQLQLGELALKLQKNKHEVEMQMRQRRTEILAEVEDLFKWSLKDMQLQVVLKQD